MICSLGISNFLEEISSLSHSVVFLYSLHCSLKKAFLPLLAILWNSAFSWVYLSLTFMSKLILFCVAWLFSFLSAFSHFADKIWASLVAQLVKNPPAMWETWVRSLGWEDPLEKGKAPIFWPGEFHGLYRPWGCKQLDKTERLSRSLIKFILWNSRKT